jgi:hypothetical protein
MFHLMAMVRHRAVLVTGRAHLSLFQFRVPPDV